MLKVWVSPDKLVRPAIRLGIEYRSDYPYGWAYNVDPLFRHLAGGTEYVVPLDPVTENSLFVSSPTNNIRSFSVSRQPTNSKVKDNYLYDDKYYGSFVDNLQDFGRVIGLKNSMSPSKQVFSQHYVRHKSYKGQAFVGLQDLSDTAVNFNWFNTDFSIRQFTHPVILFTTYPSGVTVLEDTPNGNGTVWDISPILVWLSEREFIHDSYTWGGELWEATISGFSFSSTTSLRINYHTNLLHHVGDDVFSHSFDCYYDSSENAFVTVSTSPNLVRFYGSGALFGLNNHTNDEGINREFDASGHENSDMVFVARSPADFDGAANSVTEYSMSVKMNKIASSFWSSVDLNLFDITALSRDTATMALNRLSQQAFVPNVGKIKSITPIKVHGDSLLAGIVNAGLHDFQLSNIKDFLGKISGGKGLVRYRKLFSDALQLINSLEVLGSMRNEPSRFYVADALYDYSIVLGNRPCTIRVRSKAYLKLSPLGLVRILMGKQYIDLLTDLLYLYYSSQPLGELLLVISRLSTISDIISSRMFYDLPMFFVHSYEVKTQLTQAEKDYTGISDVASDPAFLTYYIRDVSRHLPTLRFSNLVPFYGTGDVGDIIWTLLQQLVGVLSGGT